MNFKEFFTFLENKTLKLSNIWFNPELIEFSDLELKIIADILTKKGFPTKVDKFANMKYYQEIIADELDKPEMGKAFDYAIELIEKFRKLDLTDIPIREYCTAAYDAKFGNIRFSPQIIFQNLSEELKYAYQYILNISDAKGNPTQKAIEIGAGMRG